MREVMLRITPAAACAGMAVCLLNAQIAVASPPAKMPTLDGALAQLQSGQPAAAATSLRVLTVMDPRNAAASGPSAAGVAYIFFSRWMRSGGRRQWIACWPAHYEYQHRAYADACAEMHERSRFLIGW